MQENSQEARLLELCNRLASHLAEIPQRVESAKEADAKLAESEAAAIAAKGAQLRTTISVLQKNIGELEVAINTQTDTLSVDNKAIQTKRTKNEGLLKKQRSNLTKAEKELVDLEKVPTDAEYQARFIAEVVEEFHTSMLPEMLKAKPLVLKDIYESLDAVLQSNQYEGSRELIKAEVKKLIESSLSQHLIDQQSLLESLDINVKSSGVIANVFAKKYLDASALSEKAREEMKVVLTEKPQHFSLNQKNAEYIYQRMQFAIKACAPEVVRALLSQLSDNKEFVGKLVKAKKDGDVNLAAIAENSNSVLSKDKLRSVLESHFLERFSSELARDGFTVSESELVLVFNLAVDEYQRLLNELPVFEEVKNNVDKKIYEVVSWEIELSQAEDVSVQHVQNALKAEGLVERGQPKKNSASVLGLGTTDLFKELSINIKHTTVQLAKLEEMAEKYNVKTKDLSSALEEGQLSLANTILRQSIRLEPSQAKESEYATRIVDLSRLLEACHSPAACRILTHGETFISMEAMNQLLSPNPEKILFNTAVTLALTPGSYNAALVDHACEFGDFMARVQLDVPSANSTLLSVHDNLEFNKYNQIKSFSEQFIDSVNEFVSQQKSASGDKENVVGGKEV